MPRGARQTPPSQVLHLLKTLRTSLQSQCSLFSSACIFIFISASLQQTFITVICLVGCFSKDQVYLDGILKILRYREKIDFPLLMALGKVDGADCRLTGQSHWQLSLRQIETEWRDQAVIENFHMNCYQKQLICKMNLADLTVGGRYSRKLLMYSLEIFIKVILFCLGVLRGCRPAERPGSQGPRTYSPLPAGPGSLPGAAGEDHGGEPGDGCGATCSHLTVVFICYVRVAWYLSCTVPEL